MLSMRRFKQLLAGRQASMELADTSLEGFEIPLKRWFGVASHRCPAENLRLRQTS
jgi:hypothetical protein